jgi:MFS family permease
MIWQLYMVKELKLSTAYLGFTMAIFLVVLAVGNSLAGILLKRFEGVKVSIMGQSLIAIGSITIASHASIVAFYLGASLIELGLGIDKSASSVWVHDLIPSERRASYISAISAAGSLFGFTIPLVSGYIADQIGFRYNWLLAFIGSIITITLLIKIGTKIRTVREVIENVEESN